MKKVRIITDSTADMAERYQKKVTVAPLTVRFGEEEYEDGITLDRRTFYEKLVECDTLPATSQAVPETFRALYEEAAAAGESAVVITISSKLSGTYQSACLAAEDFPDVYVVDSLSATTGTGILVEHAVDCAEQGMDGAALAKHLEEKRQDVCLIAMLDTLEYLKKGGRISKAAAFAGGLLNIKPVVSLKDGEVVVVGKARGSRQGNNLLIEKIRETGGVDFSMPIMLGYTGLTDALLKKYVEDSRDLWQGQADNLDAALVCSVIGTHVGPGAIVASFFRKTRP